MGISSSYSSSLLLRIADESSYEAGSVNDTPAHSLDGRARSPVIIVRWRSRCWEDARLARVEQRRKRKGSASTEESRRRRRSAEDVRTAWSNIVDGYKNQKNFIFFIFSVPYLPITR